MEKIDMEELMNMIAALRTAKHLVGGPKQNP